MTESESEKIKILTDAQKIQLLLKELDLFFAGFTHFLSKINFGASFLDAEAIKWLNESPGRLIAIVKEIS